MQAKFCPFCQRKNKSDAVRCEHCGVLLISQEPKRQTTVSVSDHPERSQTDYTSCYERVKDLPENNLALFIMDFSEPIIVPYKSTIVLGRDDEATGDQVVNLSRFGDIALGISRKHAVIRYSEGKFSLEDMGSTNGTWLNRHRLMPGKTHTLRSDDQIWLGPLKILFCLGEDEHPAQTIFWLQSTHPVSGKSQPLTPRRLTQLVGPYLQALLDIDQAIAACLGQPESEVSILSLVLGDKGLEVKLSNASETVHFVHQWLEGWRQKYGDMLDNPEVDAQEALISLAIEMVESLASESTPEEMAAQSEMFYEPIKHLITSPLTLHLE